MAVAILALLFTILAFVGGGQEEIYWLWILVVLGVPLYIFILWRRAGKGQNFGGGEQAPVDQDVNA
jgi:hypothetical protein